MSAAGLTPIERATGLSRAELVTIAARVKANGLALTNCAAHDFALIEPAQPLRNRYRCSRCGGEVDGISHLWFERGRQQGRAEGATP